MENLNRKHVTDEPSNGMAAKHTQENRLSENESQTDSSRTSGTDSEGNPLPKIKPHTHSHGYKMFSTRSSGDDIPKTSTGI